ncbi:hypothetical protein GCM10022222_26680 [Amycolatopsis ultiminotia]|uniref:Uncharacterized protein n=1 Tax=Amycolatopsis ultiminotia TaxID=543629 RepID=A0ABP6VUD9_9PSEU
MARLGGYVTGVVRSGQLGEYVTGMAGSGRLGEYVTGMAGSGRRGGEWPTWRGHSRRRGSGYCGVDRGHSGIARSLPGCPVGGTAGTEVGRRRLRRAVAGASGRAGRVLFEEFLVGEDDFGAHSVRWWSWAPVFVFQLSGEVADGTAGGRAVSDVAGRGLGQCARGNSVDLL